MGSLAALRAATLEQLRAVPGMSDVKARHIQSFLADAPVAPEPEDLPASLEDTVVRDAGNHDGMGTPAPGDVSEVPVTAVPVAPLSEWLSAGAKAREQSIALLTCPPAPDFRARLLRELVRFASGLPAWESAIDAAGEKEQDRALRRVRRLQELLEESLSQSELDRKTQARLADDIAEVSDRLAALSGLPELSRKPEDAHE